MAARHDLDVYQGDDHTWSLKLYAVDRTDPDNPIKVPFNLNDYTIVAHIREDFADIDITVDAALVFQVTDAVNGAVNMLLMSEDAEKLAGRYRWDLQLVRNADDYITTLLYGYIKAQMEVTRP